MRVIFNPKTLSMSKTFRRAQQARTTMRARGHAVTIHNSGAFSLYMKPLGRGGPVNAPAQYESDRVGMNADLVRQAGLGGKGPSAPPPGPGATTNSLTDAAQRARDNAILHPPAPRPAIPPSILMTNEQYQRILNAHIGPNDPRYNARFDPFISSGIYEVTQQQADDYISRIGA